MRPVIAAGSGLVLLALVAILVVATDNDDRAPALTVVNPAPSPIISGPATTSVTAQAPRPPAAARAAARRFLTGYLRLLYGHGSAREITDATQAVRRQLRNGVRRVPAAQRMRQAQVVDLRATVQAPRVVVITASVDDGDVAVYPLVFTVEQHAERWQTADLSDH